MYILVYDIVNAKRLRKIANICEKYLIRIQKSVFEGELTPSQIHALRCDINREIEKEEDSVIIFEFPKKYEKKKIMMGIIPQDPYVIL